MNDQNLNLNKLEMIIMLLYLTKKNIEVSNDLKDDNFKYQVVIFY